MAAARYAVSREILPFCSLTSGCRLGSSQSGETKWRQRPHTPCRLLGGAATGKAWGRGPSSLQSAQLREEPGCVVPPSGPRPGYPTPQGSSCPSEQSSSSLLSRCVFALMWTKILLVRQESLGFMASWPLGTCPGSGPPRFSPRVVPAGFNICPQSLLSPYSQCLHIAELFSVKFQPQPGPQALLRESEPIQRDTHTLI